MTALAGLFLLNFLWAQEIKSDCLPAEVKVMASADIVAQFASPAKLLFHDCTPVKLAADKEMLATVHILNAGGGMQSYFALWERKGHTEKSQPHFKSGVIGFDAFPVLLDLKHRLLFIHPSSDKAKIVVYLNMQTSPNTSRFARWEFVFEGKTFGEVSNRFWIVEAGIMPKIYDDRGSYRALIEQRSVEL